MNRYGGEVSIEHDRGPLEAGRDLREQLKPLASQRGFQGAEAGDVPARLIKPRDDASYGFFSKPPVTVEEVGTGCNWP